MQLHTDSKYAAQWIEYSVIDAEVTFYLRDHFHSLLESLSVNTVSHKNPIEGVFKNNMEIYQNYWRPFGELLTDMEREGIKVDVNYLRVSCRIKYIILT